jgi:uncharacterized damage-inducible protein DinB
LEDISMSVYGGKHLAEAFRTVRANTIVLAEDIPDDKYGFAPTPEMRSVAAQLAHVASSTNWQVRLHESRVTHVDFEMFSRSMAAAAATEQTLATKTAVLRALEEQGALFATFLDGLSDEVLAERVTFPPPVQPSSRTRFEMLLSAKEHEMHHRAQLMVYQRLLGVVPHLTRRREQSMRTVAGAGAGR